LNKILVILFLSVLLLACSAQAVSPTVVSEAQPIAEPIDLPDYKNATYLVEGSFVTLTDGVFEVEAAPGSATKITTRYFGNEAIGDLNNDGKDDVAFLLTQEAGGSGTFFYVVVALQTASGVEGTNAIFLGDRIAPQNTSIENGLIIVNYADRNPGEPFTTQPSLGVSKYFKIENNILTEVQKP
jgi:hypothetical protein